MSGLTNEYLEKLSQRMLGKKLFLGVFPADIHPKVGQKKKTFCLIFNTGRSNTAGEHFISVFAIKKRVFYFDSFGFEPIQKDINMFLKGLNKKCVFNCQQLQDLNSQFCGFYSLSFLLWKKKQRPICNFYRMFSTKNLRHNDDIVTKFIIKQIK